MAFLEGRGLRLIHLEDMRRRVRAGSFHTWPTPLPEEAYTDNWVATHALRLISGAPRNRPWFLQVNFLGPHDPWDVTAEMIGLYRDQQEFVVPTGVSPKDVEAHRAVRRNYAAMIENIDRWIGVILDALKVSGELANTLIVVSSDHGEMLGNRGIWGKGVPFQASVTVPLVVAGPGVSHGAVIPTPTTILDLAATFADFAVAPPITGWDSRSLRRQLGDPRAAPPRTHVFSGLRQWRSVFDGRYKLVAFRDRLVLLDLEKDPGETINFAGSNSKTVARLSALLRERGQDTLAIRERALGPEHPDTAASLNNLAFLLRAQGDLRSARRCSVPSILIRRRASTSSPFCFAPRVILRGRGRSLSGRWRSARRCSVRSIPIRRGASTISPSCFAPRAILRGRGRSLGGRWRSTRRIIRLIRKWLKAGILENGIVSVVR
jgi:Sulfatase/Tetratricopeptide repeat